MMLPSNRTQLRIGIDPVPWLQIVQAYEAHLIRIRRYRSRWPTPRCYLSHMPEQIAWAEILGRHLLHAGICIVEQSEHVQPDDFVIVLDVPSYKQAYHALAPTLTHDIPLVRSRLGKKGRLIALELEGRCHVHGFQSCTLGMFCDETHYQVGLFDLVLNLYSIPLTHASFSPLRQRLHEMWEQTLAEKQRNDMTAFKVFISYSHKDERFKDELVTMLAGLQRRGIVDAWHDRRIEAGDEWHKSIQNAMDDCDIAILLVSPDYLASRFIQEDEQPKLLKRREEMKARVMPIIIRPCVWQSEETISILQVMPKDGKAVITFSKENGDRDQAWADIASDIEKRAKAKSTP